MFKICVFNQVIFCFFSSLFYLVYKALDGFSKASKASVWVSDKVLQDQGLIRIDSLLSKDLNYDFLNIQNPVYLVAIIHSGKFHGTRDAHVMRCFYNPSDKNLVWLQSGGTKQVTFVKRLDEQLITGIPQSPVDTFCRTDYPCSLGYY